MAGVGAVNGASMTTMKEDLALLENLTGRKILGEDVQTSGHGTSYPTPGQSIKGGVRNPSDGDQTTNPKSAQGDSPMEGRRGRVSGLRLRRGESVQPDDKPEGEEPENPEGDENPDDQEEARIREAMGMPDDEDDFDFSGGDGRDSPGGKEERSARRRAEGDDPDAVPAEGDEERPGSEDEGDDKDMPPEEVDVGDVKVKAPEGDEEKYECRRAAMRAGKALVEHLRNNPDVVRGRKRIAKVFESVFGSRSSKGADKKASQFLTGLRELSEGMLRPSSTFDDLYESFEAVANLEEQMVRKYAEIEAAYDMPAAVDVGYRKGRCTFKTLAEASLVRAIDASMTLREMRSIEGNGALRRGEVSLLESRLRKAANEQQVAFRALGDVLASIGRLDEMAEAADLDIDWPEGHPSTESEENPATLGDVPSEGRIREDEAPPWLKDKIAKGEVDLSKGDDGKSYDEMDGDELQKEAAVASARLREVRRRMESRRRTEDGRMPTDVVHGEDKEEPVNPDLPYEGRIKLRPRTAPRRR